MKTVTLTLTEQEFKYLSGVVLHPIIYGGIAYEVGADIDLMKKVFTEFNKCDFAKDCKFNEYYDKYYKDKLK